MLFEAAAAQSAPASLKPKFKMQGSFAYRTLNEPAHTPPQEIDLDDGIFVPVSFLNDNGRSHPALISSGYFRAVEALLTPVCRERSWTLVTDKPSCVRVELDDGAHIDFALYAIPDEEFEELVETEVLAKAMGAQDRAMLTEQIELAEDLYRGLREDQIMLAHREEGWKPSDPRKLEDWFRAALRKHGEQLRRVCRYLKGWRDYNWEACRLSSIALMACVVTTYDEAAQAPADNRDDLALLEIADRLPDLLRGRIAIRSAHPVRCCCFTRRSSPASSGTSNYGGGSGRPGGSFSPAFEAMRSMWSMRPGRADRIDEAATTTSRTARLSSARFTNDSCSDFTSSGIGTPTPKITPDLQGWT